MKKTFLLGTLSAVALMMVGTGANQAFAAGDAATSSSESTTTSDTSKSTTAQFEVENGKLQLTGAPDLEFGSHDLKSLASDRSAIDLETGGDIVVSNYDSTVSSWQVTAQASTFKNEADSSNELTNAKMTITPAAAVVSGTGDTASSATQSANTASTKAASGDNVVGTAVPVLNSTADNALGITTATVGKGNATLDLSGVPLKDLKGGATYTATIDWELSNTTVAPTASSIK
ncbi:hypothetical protein IV38_GL001124 [Lactobacillus selangorensis]|uniref:WxL domain-containing protein n=1 Tax=Lactobacillus selangorensis TaxID=81857 RepID=A0A0R2FVM3_9LACO|nr:WxL domain-containing protein [Lactobacillus selangorensis]KRN28916.1 hypothetical protein IV38_GL001124 [Lactobacillus selangorensis]KRN32674.1 hypothetical protein IV40_GL000729 [Lactobacillus selangorensis]